MAEPEHGSGGPENLAGVRETLTSQEERFERWRNTIGLFLGPLVALLIYFIPMPSLTPKAHVLASVIGLVGVWWITEPIPIPMSALLGAVLCVVLGIAGAKQVFAPFADPIIQLFLGSFMLAEAMAVHGLNQRFAFAITSMKAVGNSTGRIMLAFGLICGFLSMWISNTAATAMMFPIGLYQRVKSFTRFEVAQWVISAEARIQSFQSRVPRGTGPRPSPARGPANRSLLMAITISEGLWAFLVQGNFDLFLGLQLCYTHSVLHENPCTALSHLFVSAEALRLCRWKYLNAAVHTCGL